MHRIFDVCFIHGPCLESHSATNLNLEAEAASFAAEIRCKPDLCHVDRIRMLLHPGWKRSGTGSRQSKAIGIVLREFNLILLHE